MVKVGDLCIDGTCTNGTGDLEFNTATVLVSNYATSSPSLIDHVYFMSSFGYVGNGQAQKPRPQRPALHNISDMQTSVRNADYTKRIKKVQKFLYLFY